MAASRPPRSSRGPVADSDRRASLGGKFTVRLSQLFSPTILSTGIHGVGLALRLVFVLVLARQSGPAMLGYFGLLTATEMIAIYAAGFELHTFSTRRYARHAGPSQLRISFALHTWIFRYSAVFAATIAVGTTVLFSVPLDIVGYVCFAVIAAAGAVAQEIGRYLVLMSKPIRAIVLAFLRTAGWMPVVIPFIGSGAEALRSILLCWATASTLAMAWGLHASRAAIPRHLRMRHRYVWHAMGKSLSYYAVATASVVQSNVERFVLQAMLGPVAVGIYSLFLTLANALTAMIQAGVVNIFMPRLLTAFGTMAADRGDVLRSAMKRSLLVCLLMSAMILVGSVPIVKITAHSDYLSYWWILPMLLTGQTILMWTQPEHLALFGAHHDRLLLSITLTSLLVSLGVSAALISLAGVAGAAFAPLVVNLAVAYARHESYKRLTAKGRA
jgi:O-antigen/teichoic acid export membrane protein